MKVNSYFRDYSGFNLKCDSEKQERYRTYWDWSMILFMTAQQESNEPKLHELLVNSRASAIKNGVWETTSVM